MLFGSHLHEDSQVHRVRKYTEMLWMGRWDGSVGDRVSALGKMGTQTMSELYNSGVLPGRHSQLGRVLEIWLK